MLRTYVGPPPFAGDPPPPVLDTLKLLRIEPAPPPEPIGRRVVAGVLVFSVAVGGGGIAGEGGPPLEGLAPVMPPPFHSPHHGGGF